MSIHTLMLQLAIIAFGLGAGNVPGMNWLCLGLCFGTISLLV